MSVTWNNLCILPCSVNLMFTAYWKTRYKVESNFSCCHWYVKRLTSHPWYAENIFVGSIQYYTYIAESSPFIKKGAEGGRVFQIVLRASGIPLVGGEIGNFAGGIFYQVVGLWRGVILTIQTFFKGKKQHSVNM